MTIYVHFILYYTPHDCNYKQHFRNPDIESRECTENFGHYDFSTDNMNMHGQCEQDFDLLGNICTNGRTKLKGIFSFTCWPANQTRYGIVVLSLSSLARRWRRVRLPVSGITESWSPLMRSFPKTEDK